MQPSCAAPAAQVTAVEPAFNRLTVFDPRLPHGVREVRGTRDPRRGRLVVTGWFTEPTPFSTGALGEAEASEALDSAMRPLFEVLHSGRCAAAGQGCRVATWLQHGCPKLGFT